MRQQVNFFFALFSEQYLKSQQSHGKKGKVAAIAASVTAALLLTFCLSCWFVVKKRKDFGMARIFGGNQIEANTNRVVGTYGYMSPEYAMEGLFSIKSDVFSFGVLLLEIISGRKNSSYYKDNFVNLIGHVRIANHNTKRGLLYVDKLGDLNASVKTDLFKDTKGGSSAAPYMLFKVSGNHLLRRGTVDSSEGLKTTWRRQPGFRVTGLAEVTLREGRNEVWTVIRGLRAKDASRRKRCRRGPLEPSWKWVGGDVTSDRWD
ncbi:hypothetical protein Vadar_031751 [Vaccinium darrowii]|uniref:Uncharacterized protein n=1 Tax=Vaccinium darrowii TaxID=229202 RepID=A0ACB7XDY5_9ERIC|nr:hypothetical protein Vadar_031751 [Vaccinium darrowii]